VLDVKDEQNSMELESRIMTSSDSMKDAILPNIGSFKELRLKRGFIDNTGFILHFHEDFGDATCFLKPRRSGKSLTVKMLDEFYRTPKIDVVSYDPATREHDNINETSKASFEGTLIDDLKVWEYFWNEPKSLTKDELKERKDAFFKENMNKWPVIVVDFRDVSFEEGVPTRNEIKEQLLMEVIKPAFKQHEEVLFIKMAERVCSKKYGEISSSAYQKLLKHYKLDDKQVIGSKIQVLWDDNEGIMLPEIKAFYQLYIGDTSYKYIDTSLKTLAEILKDFYKRKVIVLVDEHDAPVTSLFQKRTLEDSKVNTELKKSIDLYTSIVTDILKAVGKESGN
jgi:hypothetical protein